MSAIIATSTGRYFTTCKLCGKRVAEAAPLDIPIVGEPGPQVGALMKVLYKHLALNHARDLSEGAAAMSEFQAFRILSQFQYQDPTMEPRLENIRALVFQIVRKNSMTDESLFAIVDSLEMGPLVAASVLDALKAVRDACCEMGQFAPRVPKEAKIISA